MREFVSGNTVRVWVEFRDIDDAFTDPTTVSFKYRKPDDTTTTLVYPTDAAVVRDAEGKYHTDLVPTNDQAGRWRWRWEGTGTNASAVERDFIVLESAV